MTAAIAGVFHKSVSVYILDKAVTNRPSFVAFVSATEPAVPGRSAAAAVLAIAAALDFSDAAFVFTTKAASQSPFCVSDADLDTP